MRCLPSHCARRRSHGEADSVLSCPSPELRYKPGIDQTGYEMKRRDFLKTSLLTAAAGAWSRTSLGQQTASDQNVKSVLVVFKCHLDVGFTDTQANVMHTYFSKYYPAAM